MISSASEIVSSGMATQMAYQIDTRKILNKPYGKCLAEGDDELFVSFFNSRFKYTEDVCRADCALKAILRHAGVSI